MNITHLGNGVVAFSDVIDIEKHDIALYLENLQGNTNPQSYQKLEDDILLSDGGYRYDLGNYKKTPTRYPNLIYPEMAKSDKQIVEKLESIPEDPLVALVDPPAPPAPTVIGYGVAPQTERHPVL